MASFMKVRRFALLFTGVIGGALVMCVLVQNGWAMCRREVSSTFPMQIPGTTLVITNVLSYEGEYIEDDSVTFSADIAAICLENTGASNIQCARVILSWEQGDYVFDVDMLPSGMSVIVLEKFRQPYEKHNFTSCAGVQKNALTDWMAAPITVSPQGETKLRIQNPTDQPLTDVTLYFKNYIPESDLLFGGIVYEYRVGLVAPGESFIIEPYRYLRSRSRIVGIGY